MGGTDDRLRKGVSCSALVTRPTGAINLSFIAPPLKPWGAAIVGSTVGVEKKDATRSKKLLTGPDEIG